MYCWGCGTKNPNEAIFCNKCGIKLKEIPHDTGSTVIQSQNTIDEAHEEKAYDTRDRSTYTRTREKGPSGVGGWLSWYCFSLTVLVPLRMISEFIMAVAEDPDPTAIIITFLLCFGLAGYSITTGIRIWKLRPNAIRQAKIFLLVALAVNILSAIIVGAQSSGGGSTAIILVSSIISFAIWYAYLSLSSRVRNTFSDIKLIRR